MAELPETDRGPSGGAGEPEPSAGAAGGSGPGGSRDARRRTLLLVGLLAFPALLLVVRQLGLGRTIWNFRVADLADLVLLQPLIILVLALLLHHLLKHRVATPVVATFAAFSFVFVAGQAMHWAANSIDTFATEVNTTSCPAISTR